jgi:hypothetical protein
VQHDDEDYAAYGYAAASTASAAAETMGDTASAAAGTMGDTASAAAGTMGDWQGPDIYCFDEFFFFFFALTS